MVDFWELSDGDDVAKTGANFESGGGNMEPLPNNTTLLAFIEEAKIDRDRDNNQYISLRWSALAPSEYKNRKVFQKIWCLDDKPNQDDPVKYKDKMKRMLFAIDFNAGGHLVASGKMPNDANLQKAFTGKQMQIKVMLWEMDGKKGNWISAVMPKSGASAPKAKLAPKVDVGDDDIPF
jgi:hypothetical protein